MNQWSLCFRYSLMVCDDGHFREITRLVDYINKQTKQLHVVDNNGDANLVKFIDIVDVKRN